MFGVIDIGSNTIRLSLYEVEDDKIKPMLNKKRVVGLASYIDDNGFLIEKGVEKAINTLNEYNEIIERIGLENLFVFATASLRNIHNTEEVVNEIENKTNLKINVISGEEEGFYDFIGATYKTNVNNGIILDIGGGSTEIIFVMDKKIEKIVSLPIGSLNMYQKHVDKLIPTKEESKKIKKRIIDELEKIDLDRNSYSEIYGIGGSIRGASKINRDFFEIKSDNKEISRKNIKRLIDIFMEKPNIAVSEILEVVPDRIHTVPTGMIILKTIMKFYNCKIVRLCEYGIREGYLIDKVINNKNIIYVNKENEDNNKVDSCLMIDKFDENKESLKITEAEQIKTEECNFKIDIIDISDDDK